MDSAKRYVLLVGYPQGDTGGLEMRLRVLIPEPFSFFASRQTTVFMGFMGYLEKNRVRMPRLKRSQKLADNLGQSTVGRRSHGVGDIAQNVSSGDAICTKRTVIAVVDRPQDIEDEAALIFFGGDEGDADLSQG